MEITLPKMTLNSKLLSDVDKALKTEWLVTNGLGGYASSTILGMNTRKYHGLLFAAFNPPVDRRALLTKLDEEAVIEGEIYPFHSNEFTWGIQPEGYRHLTDLTLNPFPTFTYEVDGRFQLKKTVFMPHGKNATIVAYEAVNHSDDEARVSVSPLVNSRHFQSVTEKNATGQGFIRKPAPHSVTVQSPPGFLPSALTLLAVNGHFETGSGEWVETFLRTDASRVESNLDNNYCPGVFKFTVAPKGSKRFAILAARGKDENETQSFFSTTFKGGLESVDDLFSAELKRRNALLNSFQKRYNDVKLEDWLKWLVLAADSFVVERLSTQTKSVIAGYHWFEDWGRDSLISLPGLTLVTGRFDDAKQILLTFKRYCRQGVIPNRFPDAAADNPMYNTVDATLWYVDSVLQYLKYTKDWEFVQKELWSTLQSIIESHVKGTVFGIQMQREGLLSHGPQLTWMDAAPYGRPVTPRDGKAVEIQALWYNALKVMQLLASRFDESQKANEYAELANKARASFSDKFWNAERNCLFDVVTNDGVGDASLRPNQVIAVSLDFSMLDNIKANQVVDAVYKQLWGVYGLKTLSSDHPQYHGRAHGDMLTRDNAYHNGTVWPWLLGPFVKAFLKLKNYEAKQRIFAFENFLKPLFTENIYQAGLGSLNETFDGDLPHEPDGCIAQAWSVAEPLRAYVEDVLLKRPSFEGHW